MIKVHLCTCKWHYFLMFMAAYYSIVYMSHVFFIYSSVDGHVACFHVPAIVNSAAINTGVRESFRFLLFLAVTPGEILTFKMKHSFSCCILYKFLALGLGNNFSSLSKLSLLLSNGDNHTNLKTVGKKCE